MNKEQYQKLKQAIQKANPSIMELKFGCKIKHKKTYDQYVVSFSAGEIVVYIPTEKKNEYMYDYKNHFRNNEFKILGRPITFNDIRILFKKNNDFGSCNIVLNIWDMWNEYDDLDKQSDKTKEYLYKLICK